MVADDQELIQLQLWKEQGSWPKGRHTHSSPSEEESRAPGTEESSLWGSLLALDKETWARSVSKALTLNRASNRADRKSAPAEQSLGKEMAGWRQTPEQEAGDSGPPRTYTFCV